MFYFTTGTVHQRLRCYSEGEDYPDEQEQSGPLPDIVCNIRDRSVSLPDVQVLRRQREVEVGRELRRISDEFHSQYQRRRFLVYVLIMMRSLSKTTTTLLCFTRFCSFLFFIVGFFPCFILYVCLLLFFGGFLNNYFFVVKLQFK